MSESKIPEQNIYQKIHAVMQKLAYVQKDASIDGKYKAVTYDNVISKLRELLVENGVVVFPELLDGQIVREVPTRSGGQMFLYEAKYEIHYVSIDDPEQRTSVTVSAHALDNGDKGPSKAVTVATKAAHIKMFSLETGENEESRNYENLPYTDIQKEEFDRLLGEKEALQFAAFSFTVGPDVMEALQQTFPKGKISEGKKLVRELSSKGHEKLDEYAQQITECYMNDDQAAFELVDEMTGIEKQLVAKRLDDKVIDFLKNGRTEQ